MALALCATCIVIVALLWEIAWPRIEQAHERRKANRQRLPRHNYDPGRERRAEQRARQLLQSCVNDEEWAMYRDLGFIRVWGAQADGPGGGGRPVPFPILPEKADRGLPAPDPRAAQRVLRRVPRSVPSVRQRAAAR